MSITQNRQTKIVATLGPASSTFETLNDLLNAGVNVFRLNFSHGTHDDHHSRLSDLRALEKEYKTPIGILADLQGPKLRVGQFERGKIALKIGQSFRLDLDDAPGHEHRVQLPHPEIIQAVNENDLLLMDDGKVRARVVSKGPDYLETIIESGVILSDNKGVNVPHVTLPIPALTKKDRKDLDAALDMGVDWIALSFVQRPEDVQEARELIGDKAKIIVKLEKPSALDHLDDILSLTDAVMVARGDLGVEIPPENVPPVQKKIIRTCRALGKPVIVATQMLESMITSPQPTRAEASDVATAIYDGADAIMLSAETAAGDFPVQAVNMMDRIAQSIEQDEHYRQHIESSQPEADVNNTNDAICAAAHQIAQTIQTAAIVTYTTSGSTSLRVARYRPATPILCLTENPIAARFLCLSYGVRPVVTRDVDNFDDMVSKATRIAAENDYGDTHDNLVITAGVPFGTPGSTNVIRIAKLPDVSAMPTLL